MGASRGSRVSPGFTLPELIVVVGIMATLAGVMYAAAGGARERSRQGVCTGHLYQIGQAIAMYRQDYDGSDVPGWPAQMGLPRVHSLLPGLRREEGASYLPGGRGLLYCPDDLTPGTSQSSYAWNVWDPTEMRESTFQMPPFPAVIAQRGGDYPLIYDDHHDFAPTDRPPPAGRYHLVLCLDGSVHGRYGSGPSWDW